MNINERIDLETMVFIDNLRYMCKIFSDHTLPDLPEWVQEALDELWR